MLDCSQGEISVNIPTTIAIENKRIVSLSGRVISIGGQIVYRNSESRDTASTCNRFLCIRVGLELASIRANMAQSVSNNCGSRG